MGRSQLATVESLVVQSMLHALKAQAWPESREVAQWQAEAIGFRDDAARSYVPSMRQRIDMDQLYQQALRRIPRTIDGQPPQPLPTQSTITIDRFLSSAVAEPTTS